MDCVKVRNEIDQWVFRELGDPEEEILQHLDSCKDCSKYMDKKRRLVQKIRGLDQQETVPSDHAVPTNDISQETDLESEINIAPSLPAKRSNHRITLMMRVMVAVSVALILVFGYEQYVVVNKIGRLEYQNAAISQNSQYGTAVKINQVVAILKSDPKILEHYKKINEEKANKLGLIKSMIIFEVFVIAGNDTIN